MRCCFCARSMAWTTWQTNSERTHRTHSVGLCIYMNCCCLSAASARWRKTATRGRTRTCVIVLLRAYMCTCWFCGGLNATCVPGSAYGARRAAHRLFHDISILKLQLLLCLQCGLYAHTYTCTLYTYAHEKASLSAMLHTHFALPFCACHLPVLPATLAHPCCVF